MKTGTPDLPCTFSRQHLFCSRILELLLIIAFLNREVNDNKMIGEQAAQFLPLKHLVEMSAPHTPGSAEMNQNHLVLPFCRFNGGFDQAFGGRRRHSRGGQLHGTGHNYEQKHCQLS